MYEVHARVDHSHPDACSVEAYGVGLVGPVDCRLVGIGGYDDVGASPGLEETRNLLLSICEPHLRKAKPLDPGTKFLPGHGR